MKKIVIVLVIVALAAGGWYAFTRYQARQQATSLLGLQTVSAERGDLTATVGATGTVRANQTAVLTWQTSGKVEKINVMVGDHVSAEDILAELKEASLPQSLILATVDLVTAQNALDDLLEPPTELELAQAEQAIAQAEDAVRSAEQRLSSLQSASSQTDIEQARANVILARNALDKAKENYEPYANKPEDNLTRAALQSALAQAQKSYDAAVRQLNNLLGTANAIDLAVAETNLALAQAQLNDAQEQYEQLLQGPDEDDIAVAKARIAAVEATLAMKHISAPFDGTITTIQIKPGDQVSPGSVAFRLDDLSHLLLDVQISEVDINRIIIGQRVILTFDAILGKEYHGVISQVAEVGSSSQGVVEFTVTVELSDPDRSVKTGMTAAVNIIVNELKDVLLVPNRAVRVQDGQRVVYVLRGNMPEQVKITLGASSETVSEVLDGDLRVGDQIVLNPPTQFEQGGPPPFMQR